MLGRRDAIQEAACYGWGGGVLEYLKYRFLPEVVQPGFPATSVSTSGCFGTGGRVGLAQGLAIGAGLQ